LDFLIADKGRRSSADALSRKAVLNQLIAAQWRACINKTNGSDRLVGRGASLW
jgi:hypothetical protein